MPKRGTNADRRSREYLTPEEVERLMAAAARQGRYGHRDASTEEEDETLEDKINKLMEAKKLLPNPAT